ncbi:Hok/Gef family protein [Enterobacter pseudoroggenkampii]|uniref:Hok/Gef family protein n=2 Tax=Enterobacteriaceae TaxID=543 RepID=A0ABT3XH76_9ENTR|nr:Hok/Gef family protein [Enterobacter pseudoroggenkampii]MCX8290385.1 Hok/Gef family protein [Enterobacter pseudoroggenkampii]MCX8304268.1 Hok/Gef family protein [Enterobacter pseudoroggenkampii]
MIIALTIIILTLVTRKTLCEISFRNDSFAVTARMDCRSGKSGARMRGRVMRLRIRAKDVQLRHPINDTFGGTCCAWSQTARPPPGLPSLCLR